MAHYVARQSLISAYRPAAKKHFNFNFISSSFQRRMLVGDVESSLPKLLVEHADDYDIIVWDMMVERLGVRKVSTGGMVTRNVDHAAAGHTAVKMGGFYDFGTDAHFTQWVWAFDRFMETLDQVGAREKLVVNATSWASVDIYGMLPYDPEGRSPEWFNDPIQR
ncbi:hypothetical protein GCM10009715_43580 [Paeniglutamicibacter psychrophenolicus]|uniref:Uncharacterized protein n=1 Tax=Paeniglutamicibacter psychrophenolicus TaxID=257454 RepID=A0ABS4WDY5_9MICC|nr:DUF6270 domain-containing protein [Paeniglutamicibacter psychrophenolicus]MBP2374422.1 hypothetical protein [Paeniglutamicibacter psychrophenolicus]